jgi:hypothetical protein
MAIKKTNNKKMYITGGIILAIAGISYLYRKEIKSLFVKSEPLPDIAPPQELIDIAIENQNTDTDTDTDNKIIPKNNKIDEKIKKGDKGDNVKDLQYNIRELQFYLKMPTLKADGDFGKITDQALNIISDFYKKNKYWTIRKARETVVRYAGEKGRPYPIYLTQAENVKDLRKIYDTAVVKKVITGKIR